MTDANKNYGSKLHLQKPSYKLCYVDRIMCLNVSSCLYMNNEFNKVQSKIINYMSAKATHAIIIRIPSSHKLTLIIEPELEFEFEFGFAFCVAESGPLPVGVGVTYAVTTTLLECELVACVVVELDESEEEVEERVSVVVLLEEADAVEFDVVVVAGLPPDGVMVQGVPGV